ncbi:MAG: pyrroline-5-carboxylate reductase [Xanthobacteraceae bacterium]|uniref:pyrroline-5-carboxylate reductase n=1 Tax=Pseudolabrys sp. TaxID=1960880 RepID=UPI003D13BE55
MAKRPARQPKPARIGRFAGKLALLGAGNMGGAMLAGWIARGLSPKKIVVVEPNPAKSVKALTRKGLILNPTKLPKDIAAIVVAIKPQAAPDILPKIAPAAGKAMIVSIMAGRTIGFLESMFSRSSPVVRAMPNLPASIGRGITVAAPNDNVSRAQRAFATGLLAAVGAVEWVEDEKLMDAVTATSGSGPAYVFLLAETMTKAAVAAGLSADLAARLVRETIAGSGELLRASPLDAATLRKNVTSPGGTTAAALAVLMGPGDLDTVMERAIAAATRRSRELAG